MKKDAPDAGPSIRRFANRSLEAQFGIPGAFNQARPLTDPQNQTGSSLHSFERTAKLVTGLITDCTAIGNVYRVQFEKVKQPVVAYFGSRTSNSIVGAREVNTLQPGTMVVCLWHEQSCYAQILTTVPPAGTAANLNQHSIIHGATRARVDNAHKQPFRFDSNGYIPAMLAGRPYDATCVGEVGWITETGLKIILDSFMALMGVDEGCQLSFHYHDMLVRLAAYQFQLWTSVREQESFNDQEEAQDWTGYAMYPWENMGLGDRGNPARVLSPEEWQIAEPHYGKMEPIDDYMMPWHREREFHGYLGQGGKHCVVAPATELQGSAHASYVGGSGVSDAKFPGVFDQFITADGRFCLQSAKGISIVKRAAIMLPTRRRKPEEPNGDTEESYKFSSKVGNGPEHKITGDIQTTGQDPAFNRALGVLDMHAYFFNYAGLHPFFYHDKDYKVFEESEAEWTGGKSAEVAEYSQLASQMYLSADQYKQTWNIDHRYTEQSFYTTSCGIDFLDDGGVLIYDGFGGSIRMTGGSVEISAPGDVWMKSGRNTNIWGGFDVSIRAKNSWDITATERDGRLKAEKNMFIFGGNDSAGIGGVLIESRGNGPLFNFDDPGEKIEMGGVVIRSKKSPFVVWSNEIYLRTGGGDITPGPIVLDAGRGQGPITLYGQEFQNYLSNGVFWHLNTQDESVEGPSAMITDSSVLMPGSMCVKGGIIADGVGIFNGAVLSTEAFAAVNCPFVGCLKGDALQAVLDAIAQCNQMMEQTIPQEVGQQFMDSVMTPQFYDDQKPGNDDVIVKAEFSLRVQEDYKTEDFRLYEDLWQQLGRLTGKANAKWEEKPVLFHGQETYPYPGKENYQGSKLYQQELTIFDPSAGRSQDRGGQPDLSGPYNNPRFGSVTPTSLNDYTVIR